MSEQFEQDDREALLRAMAKRVHNREVGVFAGHDDFGTCASCEESVTAVLAAGFRRSPAPEQVSTEATVLGIKSWRYGEPPEFAGQQVSTRDEVRRGDLDEMERLARRLRDRGFPKLAPIVRSDLVLRSADAIDALVARVREAEAERDEGWRVAAEQTRLERARAERAEAVIAGALELARSVSVPLGVPEATYYYRLLVGTRVVLSRYEFGDEKNGETDE